MGSAWPDFFDLPKIRLEMDGSGNEGGAYQLQSAILAVLWVGLLATMAEQIKGCMILPNVAQELLSKACVRAGRFEHGKRDCPPRVYTCIIHLKISCRVPSHAICQFWPQIHSLVNEARSRAACFHSSSMRHGHADRKTVHTMDPIANDMIK